MQTLLVNLLLLLNIHCTSACEKKCTFDEFRKVQVMVSSAEGSHNAIDCAMGGKSATAPSVESIDGAFIVSMTMCTDDEYALMSKIDIVQIENDTAYDALHGEE